jgi:integrase
MQSKPYELIHYRGKFALCYRDEDGQRKRPSLGTADRGIAEARAREFWQARQKPTSERVDDLWTAYIRDRERDGKDITRQRFAWKPMQPFFGYRLGNHVTKDECREYFDLRRAAGMALSTVRTELEYLRACLNLRYGKANSQVWVPPASRPRDDYLTHEQVRKLLASVTTPHVRLFIILALTTGARMSAILELTWDRVDFAHRVVDLNLPEREQSNKRRAVVPINASLFSALSQAKKGALSDHVIEWDGQPVKSIKKAIRHAAKRSGVKCSPHMFRHTAGVWMAQNDVPMQKISQYLGHTSSRVTERVYARYSPSYMSDASSALELGFI